MDAAHGQFVSYREKLSMSNPILMAHFHWMYKRVADVLGQFSGDPCHYLPDLACPGFHIYMGDGEGGSASMHYDLQYQSIDWNLCPQVDLERQLSYTLALRLPTGGSGLYVWNVSDYELRKLTAEERKKHLAANRQPSYHGYKIGEIVVHNGHYLHQIARLRQLPVGEYRITLQGHAVASGNGWILYW
jgi:hypothetical protein